MTALKKEKNTQTVKKTAYVFIKMSEDLMDGLNKAIRYSTDVEYARAINNERQMFKSLEKKVEKLNKNFENLIKGLFKNELMTRQSYEENIGYSKDNHPILGNRYYMGNKTKSYFEEYFDKNGLMIEKLANHANYEEGLNADNYLQHIVLKFDLPSEKSQEKNIQEQIKDRVFKEMPYANLTIALVEKFTLKKEFDFTINSLSSLKKNNKAEKDEVGSTVKYQTYFYLGRKIQNDKKQELLVETEKVDEKLKNIIKKLKKETDLTEDKIALVTEIEQEVVKVILTDQKNKEMSQKKKK